MFSPLCTTRGECEHEQLKDTLDHVHIWILMTKMPSEDRMADKGVEVKKLVKDTVHSFSIQE